MQRKPFVPNALFLYTLKASENRMVISGGREKMHREQMG